MLNLGLGATVCSTPRVRGMSHFAPKQRPPLSIRPWTSPRLVIVEVAVCLSTGSLALSYDCPDGKRDYTARDRDVRTIPTVALRHVRSFAHLCLVVYRVRCRLHGNLDRVIDLDGKMTSRALGQKQLYS